MEKDFAIRTCHQYEDLAKKKECHITMIHGVINSKHECYITKIHGVTEKDFAIRTCNKIIL